MAGRRSALQWRKLARQNCLRGRAARYVAAAALWLVAACGCCLALLLGAAAAANYAARCPCCGAAAELSALCAADVKVKHKTFHV